MEIVTSPNGEVLRRPQVAYTVATGDTVIASPLIFRTASKLDKGSEVQVRYAKTKPAGWSCPASASGVANSSTRSAASRSRSPSRCGT